MAFLLAPYNDGMRLGMGFNFYTQTPCINGAVTIATKAKDQIQNSTSQTVSYSSRFVEKLSDVLGAMNISSAASIKSGTVEVSGNSSSINEDKIKASDLNAVVTVRVVNQTTVIEENSTFVPIGDGKDGKLTEIPAGSHEFNSIYGDCYISGFVYGGDFTGVISMKVLDSTKKVSITDTLKRSLSSGGKDATFTLDPVSFGTDASATAALKETETTVSVNWMGGGQVKDPTATWDVNSMFAAAAAFPDKVATCPQRTWAILTKYTANRSFVAWSRKEKFTSLMYDNVLSYTDELFENFMEYKQLVKLTDQILASPGSYQSSKKGNAIKPDDVNGLLAVRSAMRYEMDQIVVAVDVLANDPHSLKRNSTSSPLSNDMIKKILDAAHQGPKTSDAPHGQKDSIDPKSRTGKDGPEHNQADTSEAGIMVGFATQNIKIQPKDDDSQSVTTFTVINQIPSDQILSTASGRVELNFKFDELVSPEVFGDILPKPGLPSDVLGPGGLPPNAGIPSFKPPPDTNPDTTPPGPTPSGSKSIRGLILSARCLDTDATDKLVKLFNDWMASSTNPKTSFKFTASADLFGANTNPQMAVVVVSYKVWIDGQPETTIFIQGPVGSHGHEIEIDFELAFLYPTRNFFLSDPNIPPKTLENKQKAVDFQMSPLVGAAVAAQQQLNDLDTLDKTIQPTDVCIFYNNAANAVFRVGVNYSSGACNLSQSQALAHSLPVVRLALGRGENISEVQIVLVSSAVTTPKIQDVIFTTDRGNTSFPSISFINLTKELQSRQPFNFKPPFPGWTFKGIFSDSTVTDGQEYLSSLGVIWGAK